MTIENSDNVVSPRKQSDPAGAPAAPVSGAAAPTVPDAQAAAQPESFKEARLRISELARKADAKSKADVVPILVSEGYPQDNKWHYVLLANIVRILGIGAPVPITSPIDVKSEQSESERAGDVSVLIDDLRERARQGDIPAARLYWEIIQTRQTEDEISPELRAQASQAVALAMDVHVKGLPECCDGAVRAFVKRVQAHVK